MAGKPPHTQRAGGVVLNKNGEVLVVNQHGLHWSLPKGGIEAGEDPIAAARREIYEESGVQELVFIKPLGQYERYKMNLSGGDDRTEFRTIQIFLFKTSQIRLKPVDPHNPEARWIKKEKVASLLTHPKDKEFFERIINEI